MDDEKSYRLLDLTSAAAAGGEERLTVAANLSMPGSDWGVLITDIIPGIFGVRRGTTWPLINLTLSQVVFLYAPGTNVPGIGELERTSNFVCSLQLGNVLQGLNYRLKGAFTIQFNGYLQGLFLAGDRVQAQFTLAYKTIPAPALPNFPH